MLLAKVMSFFQGQVGAWVRTTVQRFCRAEEEISPDT